MSAYLEPRFSEAGIEFRAAAQDWLRHPERLAPESQAQAGVVAAAQVGLDASITNLLPKADELAFTGLEQLVSHSAQSNQH